MSHGDDNIAGLFELAAGMLRGVKGSLLVKKYESEIKEVEAEQVVVLVDKLVEKEPDLEKVKQVVNKLLNLFYKGLTRYGPYDYSQNRFLSLMVEENKAAKELLQSLKPVIKKLNEKQPPAPEWVNSLVSGFEKLNAIELHYIKMQNLVFPAFEKQFPLSKCFRVMWSMQDDVVQDIRTLLDTLRKEPERLKRINRLMGDIFFHLNSLIFREEYILFPTAMKYLEDKVWEELLEESLELGYCFIEVDENIVKRTGEISKLDMDKIELTTGALTINQLENIFASLPLEMTFVDHEDKVRFFSRGAGESIFLRSKAVLGRDVRNCHPQKSLDKVIKILESFKSSKKSMAEFWINFKRKKVWIRYFAVRNMEGKYLGTLEVVMDITHAQELKGEKRLLDLE